MEDMPLSIDAQLLDDSQQGGVNIGTSESMAT
jgi:hypothetical protein